ncbi:hypothetical protein DFJ73DRAFT_838368 [Zopfochytrium polystomum]|nr:hypothetical protein DFJ73DRAFT_838368 [Zopfochytrium polystomum]
MLVATATTTARPLLAAAAAAARPRAFSAAAAGANPKSGGGNTWLYGAVGLVVAGGAYYAWDKSAAKAKENGLAIKYQVNPSPALKGDDKWVSFKLEDTTDISPNTKKFKFVLPDDTTHLGLSTASMVLAKFTGPDGKPVIRPYTPVEEPDKYTGNFDLIVKKYPNGPMSTHIHELKKGDTLELQGPIPKYPYVPNKDGHIGMVAGGTGITPMLQVIRKIFSNPSDKTKVTLVFANVTEQDILLKEYFDGLAKKHPEQFSVVYTLDKPPAGWTGYTGFVNETIVKNHLPKPGQGKVFVCGPNPMLASLAGMKAPDFSQGELSGLFKKLGYTSNDVYKF